MLLVVALRFGHVYGNTLQEVLQHTARRADRVVQWRSPERPVICKIPRGPVVSTLDNPAPEQQLGRTLKQMALAAGVLDRVTSHAVRRGAMRDSAYVKKAVTGLETACASLIGGHSKQAENRGLTREYVGALQTPVYNLRAETKFNDRLGPKFAAAPMVMHRNTTAQINAYMDAHDMDKSDPMKRATASLRLQEEQVSDWVQAERDREAFDPKPAVIQINKARIGEGKTISGTWEKEISDSGPLKTREALGQQSQSEVNMEQA